MRTQPSTRAVKNGISSTGPASPFARMAQVSDVLVSPSTESMLKLTSTATRSMRSSEAASNAASVKMYDSMVAMFGSIMPEPLATHVMVASPTLEDSAFAYVSVVMIPSAPTSGSSWRSVAMPTMPTSIFSMGSVTPITPVELTSILSAVVPSSAAAAAAMRRACSTPAAPVATLLTLLLTTTPRSTPPLIVSRPSTTGAPGK